MKSLIDRLLRLIGEYDYIDEISSSEPFSISFVINKSLYAKNPRR